VIKQFEDELVLINVQVDKVNSERRKLIRESLNKLLKSRNCEHILDDIHRIERDIIEKKAHIEQLQSSFEQIYSNNLQVKEKQTVGLKQLEKDIFKTKGQIEDHIRKEKTAMNRIRLKSSNLKHSLDQLEAECNQSAVDMQNLQQEVVLAKEAIIYGRDMQNSRKLEQNNYTNSFIGRGMLKHDKGARVEHQEQDAVKDQDTIKLENFSVYIDDNKSHLRSFQSTTNNFNAKLNCNSTIMSTKDKDNKNFLKDTFNFKSNVNLGQTQNTQNTVTSNQLRKPLNFEQIQIDSPSVNDTRNRLKNKENRDQESPAKFMNSYDRLRHEVLHSVDK